MRARARSKIATEDEVETLYQLASLRMVRSGLSFSENMSEADKAAMAGKDFLGLIGCLSSRAPPPRPRATAPLHLTRPAAG